jgi:hypothetical protein
MTEKDQTGKKLERRVADAYREIGARKVEHDVELAGNQIDVYVELETPGRLLHRIAVEAKDWTKPVGIAVVNGFAQIVKLLRSQQMVDEGIIISATGFSKQARNAARTYGIRLLEPADLDAMVAESALLDASERLNEWKELHNLLQEFLTSFGPFHRQVDLAYAGGGSLDWPSLEINLHPCDTQVAKLISFAAKINYIGKRYEKTRDGLYGEGWVVETVTGYRRVKAVVEERGDSRVLSNLANEIDSICNAHLDFADKQLHQTAIQVTRNLRDWQKGLANERES